MPPKRKRSLDSATASHSEAKKQKPKISAQEYRKEYTDKFPCIQECKRSKHSVFCAVCCTEFSIMHGGLNDVTRHVNGSRHKSRSHCDPEQFVPSQSLPVFFKATDLSVIQAETLFTTFVAEHNLPASVADHFNKLCKKMFPDSEVAKDFACGRTKTGHIIRTLAEEAVKEASIAMQSSPYVLATDGSQEGGDKFFPIVARYLDDHGNIQTDLLGVPTCQEAATGENIFNLLDATVRKRQLKWDHCCALVTDNANVMVGKHKGVISFIRNKNPSVHLAGCVCHLLNLAAKKATKAFQGEFLFDDILRQIHWYLDQSSTRQQRLKELQSKAGVPQVDMVQHCPTRWLSLGAALKRLLEQWDPLQQMFEAECSKDGGQKETAATKSEPSKDSIKHRIRNFLRRRTARLYSYFLSYAIEHFDIINKEMQTESACIHKVKRRLESFYHKLLLCFVKPSAMNSGLRIDVHFTQKCNIKEDLMTGEHARNFIMSSGISNAVVKKFHEDVVKFYQAACQYLKDNVLMVQKEDPHPAYKLWKHAEVADPSLRTTTTFASVRFFLTRFPCMQMANMDELEMEFLDFQSTHLPADLLCKPVEQQWTEISQFKDDNGSTRFKLLPRVMASILLIPVSNCSCERVFSQVRKNRTDFRSLLGPEQLEAALILKTNMQGVPCYETKLSDIVLKKCKAATRTALSQ